MATFVLQSRQQRSPTDDSSGSQDAASPELIQSARWYTRVRWIAAGIFAIVGLIFVPTLHVGTRLGILSITRPMWILAAFLAIGNLPFWLTVRRLPNDTHNKRARMLVWGQIAVDLLSVTYLVHIVGSVDTFISFFYLLHIALSCIALTRKESLVVALCSAFLYLGTVTLEATAVWSYHPIFDTRLSPVRGDPILTGLFAVSAVFLWLVIWYFISTLSQSLRRRERELREANLRLLSTDEEKNRIMIQTTHDLKTPFFGIESNIQLLREQTWERLPQSTRRIVERIRSQSKILRSRIDSILLYNELRSRTRHDVAAPEETDLPALMREVVREVNARASERQIAIQTHIPEMAITCNKRQLVVLFTNLVSNAIAYSHDRGRVVLSAHDSGRSVTVSVEDEGIGIPDEALPHIFDEYYRAKEAVRMNRMSSGLGLAIVREIAEGNSLTIRVVSTQGRGTKFEVTIPRTGR